MIAKKLSLWMMVIGMVFIVACGAEEPAATSVESPKQAAAQTEAPSPDAESSLDRIKKNGKIVIGTAATTRPTHYTNEKGELIGYDIDWGHEIAESLGVEVEFVAGSFAGLIPGLIAEKFDIVVSALVITDERKEMIDFSDRYMADGAIAVVREDNDTVTDVKKLDGLKVGVLAGSGFLEDVKKLGGYAELKEYPGYPEAFIDLKAGRVDVYVSGKTGANDFIKHDDTAVPLKMVGEIYNMHESGVGFRKNEEELVEAINKIIAEKKQDGTYDELAMKWFGYNMPK